MTLSLFRRRETTGFGFLLMHQAVHIAAIVFPLFRANPDQLAVKVVLCADLHESGGAGL